MRECVKEDERERYIERDRQTETEKGGRKRMRDCEGG